MSVHQQAADVVKSSYEAAVAKHGEKYADVVMSSFDCDQIIGLFQMAFSSDLKDDDIDSAQDAISSLLASLLERVASGVAGDLVDEALADGNKISALISAMNERAGSEVH